MKTNIHVHKHLQTENGKYDNLRKEISNMNIHEQAADYKIFIPHEISIMNDYI